MPIDQKYRDMVDAKLAANSSEIFGNFSTEHAGYIIAQFISKAEKSIEILSGGFDEREYRCGNCLNIESDACPDQVFKLSAVILKGFPFLIFNFLSNYTFFLVFHVGGDEIIDSADF